jgi:hypothetical protein
MAGNICYNICSNSEGRCDVKIIYLTWLPIYHIKSSMSSKSNAISGTEKKRTMLNKIHRQSSGSKKE